MSLGRRCVSFAITCAWLATLPAASGHRLDEYLQATLLSIDTERVDIEMNLTSGAAIASKVFAWIDTNHDGEISESEGEAYARQVLGSVVLKIDGVPADIELVHTSFPEFSDMRLGVGTIRVRATSRLPVKGAGPHDLSFLNTHHRESSVYLVNALVPPNPRVQLGEQSRDFAQLGLTMQYSVVADSSWDRAVAPFVVWTIGLALVLRFVYALTLTIRWSWNRVDEKSPNRTVA